MSSIKFRYDINGLRAIAVIAVVLYHFGAQSLPGGFAGVDVFFVISGFLMTSIIFRGLENNNFNLLSFYVARANRIIPALAVLCLALIIFGWYFLTPEDYRLLGKHIASSLGFVSNITYLKEAGYFDAASNEKWLLHTWSLSVEWQFYIIYPVVLLALSKFVSLRVLKKVILASAVVGFVVGVVVSEFWPDVAYYSLHTRAWEMMVGGLAYLYPMTFEGKKKRLVESSGLALILVTYFFVSSEQAWPGYASLMPVLGAYLIILSNNQRSFATNNLLFQYLGRCSYSIYLWHWPIVVFSFFFDYPIHWLAGLLLSILFGSLSYYLIERMKFRSINQWKNLKYVAPMYMAATVMLLSGLVYSVDGIKSRYPDDFNKLASMAESSPYRKSCHVSSYRKPSESCEYFNGNTTWAVFGDSHTVELAYALANRLKPIGEGVKHFSFSDCVPSFGQQPSFSRCTQWFNDSLEYIIHDETIQNVVLEFRYSKGFFGDNVDGYPDIPTDGDAKRNKIILESLDDTINTLAMNKKHVYVYYPVPELNKDVLNLVAQEYYRSGQYKTVQGPSLDYYKKRNQLIISHFENAQYPENVTFVKPESTFCRQQSCFSVIDSKPLYFDDNHPSLYGASLLVNELPLD